ncbi:methyltransferase FGSG_00040 [Cryptomeria japonica]|uniref:methyltransferase FGSG_00040 n=1 Tax=Cryptomeria japonica TaxID=3369 RepID=UPI0027DA5CD7|nr:methyltransferase FGSG_00040 [Cryptomeria japonica]
MVDKFKEFQASQEFDKEALIEAHEKTYKGMRQIESMRGCNITGFTMRKPSEHWRPSVPLKGLLPIRARELQIDKDHQGRVLFGTLCTDAHRMLGIMTILEDQYGDAVRLAIYNISPSTMETESPRKLYPKGSKVAVKQPYFKQGAQDGALMLRVDNPNDVEILACLPGKAENSLAKDLLELRSEGNKYFKDEDWNKAIDNYSRCIDLALSRDKIEPQVPSASNIQEKVKEALVYSYSNRAEAKLKLKEYADAVQDCDKALALDQYHLKSLFRKGRTFHYLREYKLACQCFDRALEQAPTANDIQLHYEKSMELSCQNKQGKFDLSGYFINGCNAPELSNYIGPVLIKKSVGRGRGLFATDNVDIGDFLLVDNAIASSSTEIRRLKGSPKRVIPCIIEVQTKLGQLKQELEAKIISCAASSPRILQQLEYLADSDELKVPPINLFRINNASWNTCDVPNKGWELDQHQLAKIMRNVGCQIQTIESSSDMLRQNEKYGLWVLPSFINHSCFPNANCVVVGEAMFIIATRKIAAGEEIAISYFDSLKPLSKRESVCRIMGFKCDCKRCLLERPLASPLQEIAELVNHINSITLTDFDLWKIAKRVERTIDFLTTEEKQMIRASFFQLYYNIFGLQRIDPYARTTLPSLREVFDGFQEVVPGNCILFEFYARFPVYAKNEDETDRPLFQKAVEICTTYMGKHEEGLLKAVLKSVATDVFKPGLTVFGILEVNS